MTEVIQLPVTEPPGKTDGRWHTQTVLAINSICDRTRAMADIAMITGPSGVGKTTAALAKMQESQRSWLDGEATYYASMTIAAETLQPGLHRIASSSGLWRSFNAGSSDIHDAIVKADWGEKALLIIDEAQFMTDALLHGIRNVWDDMDRGRRPIGIVLIGTPELATRINTRAKSAGRSFEPLRGRMGACIALDPIDADDVAAICRHFGVTGQMAEKLMGRVAGASGGLHNVRRLVAQAQRLAGAAAPMTFAHLKRAAEIAGVAS